MEGCSKALESKIDAWQERYRVMYRFTDEEPPTMKAVVSLYWAGLDLTRRMRDELEQLRDGIVPATARFSSTPAGHSGGHGDPTAEAACRIDILSGQVSEMEELTDCLAANIRCFINYEIDSQPAQMIYRMRVIDRLHYPEIAAKTNYTEGYCRSVVSRYGKMTVVLTAPKSLWNATANGPRKRWQTMYGQLSKGRLFRLSRLPAHGSIPPSSRAMPSQSTGSHRRLSP